MGGGIEKKREENSRTQTIVWRLLAGGGVVDAEERVGG